MTDISIRAGSHLRYVASQVKAILVKTRQVLCQSHGVEGWNTTGGSETGDIDMEEYGS